MEIAELKKHIDFSNFLEYLGYQKDREKSTKNISVYCKLGEKLVVRNGEDCKVYYKIGSPEKGTIIDFLKNRPEYLLKAPDNQNIFERIKAILNGYLNIYVEVRTTKQNKPLTSFKLTSDIYYKPKSKSINSKDFYFLQWRGISQKAVESDVFNNIGLTRVFLTYCTIELPLLQNSKTLPSNSFFYLAGLQKKGNSPNNKQVIDFLLGKNSIYRKDYKYNNVAFPIFNKEGIIKGIDSRYILNGKSMKHFISGSDKQNSIGISSDKRTGIEELILCESPIDALSHYELYRSERKDIQYIYFCGSITRGQIDTFLDYLRKVTPKHLTLGFDNDIPGQSFTTSLLCSVITNSPVPQSFASNERFSFAISHNPEKNSILFRALLKEIPVVEFHDTKNSFSFTFPKQREILNTINKRLCLAAPQKLHIDIPLAKDWNDDLKSKKK